MKKGLFGFICMFLAFNPQGIHAQEDCILGVGITPDSTLVRVFQLNGEQAEKIKNWSAELKYRNELLTNEADNLLKRHPQNSPAELVVLAEKYKAISDSLVTIQRMIDMRTLKLLNGKQYGLYLELCEKAFRQPYRVIPMKYQDSISEK